jgi:hypothetical protein
MYAANTEISDIVLKVYVVTCYMSFLCSAFGTMYIVYVYSNVVRIPKEAFKAFL